MTASDLQSFCFTNILSRGPSFIENAVSSEYTLTVRITGLCIFTWLRVAEYSGLTGRKGTALRSVTRVLWF